MTELAQERVVVDLNAAEDRAVSRVLVRLLGIALVMSAPAMWVMPGALGGEDVALIKLGASVFFLLIGLAMLLAPREKDSTEAWFDPEQREIRVLRHLTRGGTQTVLRKSYDEIADVCFEAQQVALSDRQGGEVLRICFGDKGQKQALQTQLARI